MGNFGIAHKNYILNAGGCCASAEGVNAWMSADFNPAQNLVKQAEGGYSSDTRDPGNYTGGKIGVGTLIGTNWGISAPVLVAELKRVGGAPPTASTMKNLQYASAVAIYKRNYWAPIKGDEIKNQNLANMIYDTSVNQGVGRAHEFVKDSLGITKYDIDKINSANAQSLFNSIRNKREAFYKARGGYALNSWLDRLKKLGGDVERNKGKTVLVVLGLSALIGGIYLYNKNN